MTNDIADKLEPTVLYEAYRTKSINLEARSKCTLPLSVNIINMETRDESYLVHNRGPSSWYINPKDLTRHIVNYMKDAFDKCKVIIEDNSTNVIQVSLKEAEIKLAVWTIGADIKLKIDIPEKQYTVIFEAEDWTPTYGSTAMAYAIHAATWKVITDPFIQDYILCK
jgi:hypothetical protein